MTVEATPVVPSTVVTTECDDQQIRTPRVSEYYGEPILARQQGVIIKSGGEYFIDWIMRDPNGNPIDLTSCNIGCVPDPCDSSSSSSASSMSSTSSVSSSSSSESDDGRCEKTGCAQIVFRFREILDYSSTNPTGQACAEVINACTGEIRIPFDQKVINPGIYWAEVAVLDAEDCPIVTNVFKLIVERSLWSQLVGPTRRVLQLGPPTIAEIRLHLRDSSPAESLLLDNVKFDNAEIALAIIRPIEYWNEIPPPLSMTMNTSNFPHRYHWMEAIAANLFWMVEEQFRANNLSYSAAGIQVNDQDKEQNYARAAERRWTAWKEWVRHKKASINLESCYGEVRSSYAYVNNRGGGGRGRF